MTILLLGLRIPNGFNQTLFFLESIVFLSLGFLVIQCENPKLQYSPLSSSRDLHSDLEDFLESQVRSRNDRDKAFKHRHCVRDGLSPEQLRRLSSITFPQPTLHSPVPSKHFYASDELHQDLFEPYIRGLKKTYVGIGADQNYLLMGWVQPQMAWIIDRDPHIYVLHRIFAAFLLEADDPDAFYDLWRPKYDRQAWQIVQKHLQPGDDLKLFRKVLTKAQIRLPKRLRYLKRHLDELHLSAYINDLVYYRRIQAMVQHHCVFWLWDDINHSSLLPQIAQIAEDFKWPISVIYLSNAEEYFNYSVQFKAWIQSLNPVQEAWVLRTFASKTNRDYRYHMQTLQSFQAWLQKPNIHHVYEMVIRDRVKNEQHFPLTLMRWLPPE